MQTKQKGEWNYTKSKKQKSTKAWTTITGEEITSHSESSVSVFTKTSNPKVIVKSEALNNECGGFNWRISCEHRLMKFACMVIICLIVLIIFFLSFRTYNKVNELSNYIYSGYTTLN